MAAIPYIKVMTATLALVVIRIKILLFSPDWIRQLSSLHILNKLVGLC